MGKTLLFLDGPFRELESWSQIVAKRLGCQMIYSSAEDLIKVLRKNRVDPEVTLLGTDYRSKKELLERVQLLRRVFPTMPIFGMTGLEEINEVQSKFGQLDISVWVPSIEKDGLIGLKEAEYDHDVDIQNCLQILEHDLWEAGVRFR